MIRARKELYGSGVLYAINLDQLLLAMFTKLMFCRRAILAYEVADIQRPFVRKDVVGAGVRWVERHCLNRVDLLIVTSPAYIKHFYGPVQGFRGEWFLLENKIYPEPRDQLPVTVGANKDRVHKGNDEGRWVVGWYGALKCEKSWAIINKIARTIPDKVEFTLGGYPTKLNPDVFFSTIRDVENINYIGEYRHPDDLVNIYRDIDFVWCFDFSNEENNSVWCLSNRVYEGGYFEVPLLGSKGYEVGKFIDKYHIGWTFSEPYTQSIREFFSRLTCDEYMAVRRRYKEIDKDVFAGARQYNEMCEKLESLLR